MNIKIVDVSQNKKPVELKKEKEQLKLSTEQPKLPYEIQPTQGEKCTITKTPMELLPEYMVYCEEISCERTKKGMTNNCSLCQNINKDIFIKCQTRYK